MSHIERATKLFTDGYNCAQATAAAFAENYGLRHDDVVKMAAGFGAGIARTQRICGACSGAVMLIGCRHHDEGDVKASKARVYEIVRAFLEEFRTLHGSTECRALMGVDLNTEEGMAEAKANRLFEVKCERFVIDAGNLAEKYLR